MLNLNHDKKFIRRASGRDGKILLNININSHHSQDVKVAVFIGGIGNLAR